MMENAPLIISTLDLDTFEDQADLQNQDQRIVSTWDLDDIEDLHCFHWQCLNCINLGAVKTRTSPTPTAQANDTAFPSSIISTICKQVFYPVHFRSSKGYNFFIRNTLRERSPHVRRQVGGTPEHPRR